MAWREGQRARFLSTRRVPRPAHEQLLPKLNPTVPRQEKMSQTSTELAWE